jgi:aldehyde dehydrogenase (NAD+)
MIDKKNFYINGQWVNPKSKEEIRVVNPATEQDCAVIALANKDDVNDAVVAAKNAYDTWLSHQKKKEFNY